MNEILEQALLYDFYGELLNEHQKEIYEQVLLEDLSLGEIAAEQGISRQAVHDLVRRCRKTLEGYEEKLHLVERFLAVKSDVQEIDDVLARWESGAKDANEAAARIRELTGQILGNM